MEGRWYIIYSNFPMWLKGNKINPSLNYTVTTNGKTEGLLDKVVFYKKEKEKSITGFDTPSENNTRFIWKGKGITSALKSKWEIVYRDPKETWMIIHFEKTLFTKEGYDVVAREKHLDAKMLEKIQTKLKELNIDSLLQPISQT